MYDRMLPTFTIFKTIDTDGGVDNDLGIETGETYLQKEKHNICGGY